MDSVHLDPSLIDPELLSPATRQSLLLVSPPPSRDPPALLPRPPPGYDDISVVDNEYLDPLLRNLVPAAAQPDHTRLAQQNNAEPDADASEGDPSSEVEDDDGVIIEPSPLDQTLQVEQLREMDQEASAALVDNRAYQTSLKLAIERFERAQKRTNDLIKLVKSLHTRPPGRPPTRSVDASYESGQGQGPPIDANGALSTHHALAKGKDSSLKVFIPSDARQVALPWFKYFHGRDLPLNPDAQMRELYLTTTRFWPCEFPRRTIQNFSSVVALARVQQRLSDHSRRSIAPGIGVFAGSHLERTKLKQEVMAHNHRQVALEAAEKCVLSRSLLYASQHQRNKGEPRCVGNRGEDLEEKMSSIDPNWFVENTRDLDWDTISRVVSILRPFSIAGRESSLISLLLSPSLAGNRFPGGLRWTARCSGCNTTTLA